MANDAVNKDPAVLADEYLTAAYDIIHIHRYTDASDDTAENAIALAQVIATIASAQIQTSNAGSS